MRDWTEEELDAMAHAWSNMCNSDNDENDDDYDDDEEKYDKGYRDGFCDGHKRGRHGSQQCDEEEGEYGKEKVYTTDDILNAGKVLLLPFAAVGIFGCELGKAAFNGAKSLHRAVKHRYNPWTYESWDHK